MRILHTLDNRLTEKPSNLTIMASDEAAAAEENPTKPQQQRQIKQDETKRHRSIFEVPPELFDSCRLLHSPFSPIRDSDIYAAEESNSENEVIENSNYSDTSDAKAMQKWSCNTCKAEFESLLDQRFHFKSDLHRFNIKLSIAGKSIIKEEDFDGVTSDSLCEDYDVSSISGSEEEDDRETRLRQREFGGITKGKIFIELQNGERVSVWRCLLLDESENILLETEKPFFVDGAGVVYLSQREVIEKLRYIIREPRDSTCLRIVLLARGGHFAGCVFDGNSLVANKTFHRYVVRAKAGKKQSSKDAGGGRSIHSAGASLRRYNELALKKDIQELLTSWKPHFSVATCIFIYAPSDNRQLFFDGVKPYFTCQHRAIRNIPLTVRRPTLKEARRVYTLLVQISPEIREEISLDTKSGVAKQTRENPDRKKTAESSSIVNERDGLSLSVEESKNENDSVGMSTPLHEAAKSGNAGKVLELLEMGLDPCVRDERGQTAYMVTGEKEVRNSFRRFMASNLEMWDWHAAKVPSALTKEMEETQTAKQAEKDAKRKAKAKELKKLRKAKEKKAQEEASKAQNDTGKSASVSSHKGHGSAVTSKEEEQRKIQDEREKRAAAAERRMAPALKTHDETAVPTNLQLNKNSSGSDTLCSCCLGSLAGKVPFHRYNYKYCSTSCMHVHREILEDG